MTIVVCEPIEIVIFDDIAITDINIHKNTNVIKHFYSHRYSLILVVG